MCCDIINQTNKIVYMKRIIDLEVINYFDSENKEHWIAEISKSDWVAGKYLYKIISDNSIFERMGKDTKVLLLIENENLISFCTYSEIDDIKPTELKPWVGFAYTFPKYRGNRYLGILFEKAYQIAKSENVSTLYLTTDHNGLYEKYGWQYKCNMKNTEGENTLVYKKQLLPFKTFGVKENEKYYDREGAYVIPIKDNKVCIVKTPKGCFLIGGGMDEGESETDCIARECLEETGCNIVIKEKIASSETYCRHSKLKYFHPIQHYYIGELSAKIKEPLESDHKLEWIDIEETKGKMFAPIQEWAIQIACDYLAK